MKEIEKAVEFSTEQNGAANGVQKSREQEQQVDQDAVVNRGDYVGGDKTTVGDISNANGIAVGPGARVTQYFGESEAKLPSNATVLQFLTESEMAVPIGEGNDGDPLLGLLDDVRFPFQIDEGFDKRVPVNGTLFDAVNEILTKENGPERRKVLKILADSGCGKTAALNYLQREQARESSEAVEGNSDKVIIPLFISLSYLEAGIPFKDLIRSAFNGLLDSEGDNGVEKISKAQVEKMLGSDYRFLFLLDDLEDLYSVPASRGLKELESFIEANHEHYYVLACNIAADRKQFGETEDVIVLDDLEAEDVTNILVKLNIGSLNPALQSLLRNRALLKIALKLIHKERSVEHIRSKGQLLRELNRQHLGYESRDWDRKEPNPVMLELLLEKLAFTMLQNHTLAFTEYEVMRLSHDFVREWNEPYSWRQVPDFLENTAGILKRDDQRRWSFRYKTTIAYFAAAAVLKQPDRLDVVLDDLQGSWWHDALAILISLHEDPTELCYRLIDSDVFVAAYCVRFSGVNVEDRVYDALVDTLNEKMSSENSRRRRQFVEQIGDTNHPHALDALLVALKRDWSSTVIESIVRAIAVWTRHRESEGDDSAEDFNLAEELTNRGVDETSCRIIVLSVEQLRRKSGRFPQVEMQKTINRKSASALTRGLAALALGFRQDDACRDVLIRLLRQPFEREAFVNWCVVEALTEYAMTGDEKVVDAAKDILERRTANGTACYDPSCRKRAAYLLGWASKDPTISENLMQALKDDDPCVIVFAIDALVRLQKPVQRELEAMLQAVQKPVSQSVERKIVEALEEIGDLDSSKALEILKMRESAQTRRLAKRAIATINNRYELKAGYEALL